MSIIRQYLLPAIMFQGLIIAGGYGTGQEFNQFFLINGPLNGLLGVLTSGVCWSLICAITYDCARTWQTYDYRNFFKQVLGRYWFLFEVSYLLLSLIVISVVAASFGAIFQDILGVAYNLGILILFCCVIFCVFSGIDFIEKIFSIWAMVITTAYILFFFNGFNFFANQDIFHKFNDSAKISTWFISGLSYAGYNLGLIPAVLLSTRYITTRQQAYISGLVSGFWAIIPGLLLYMIMVGGYPDIKQSEVPTLYILDLFNKNWLTLVFVIALLGTLIQTTVGLIASINNRIALHLQENNKILKPINRAILSLIILAITGIFAQFKLVKLINYGYGIITWSIVVFYLIPLLIKYAFIIKKKTNI